METRIELENISKAYGDKRLFNDLSYLFNQRCYHLVGKNGAGKSTLLRLIAGLELPDSGTVMIKNSLFNPGQQIYYVPDDLDIYPFLKGIEFISLIADQRTDNPNEISDIIEKLNLTVHQNTAIADMSLGTKKKFLLASALIGKPEFIILDEPFNGLDKASQTTLFSILKEKKDSTGIIFTTHHDFQMDLIEPVIIQVSENHLSEIKCKSESDEKAAFDGLTAVL